MSNSPCQVQLLVLRDAIALDPNGRGEHGALMAGERQRRLAMGDKDPEKVDLPLRPVVKPQACTAQRQVWLCYHCDACLAGDSHDWFGMSTVADGTPVRLNCCRLIERCSHTTRR